MAVARAAGSAAADARPGGRPRGRRAAGVAGLSRVVFAADFAFDEPGLTEPAGLVLTVADLADAARAAAGRAATRPPARFEPGRSACLRTGRMRGRGSFLARDVFAAGDDLAVAARVAGPGLPDVARADVLPAERLDGALAVRVALAARVALTGEALVAGFAAALAMLRGACLLAAALAAVLAEVLAAADLVVAAFVAVALVARPFGATDLAAALADGLATADLPATALPFEVLALVVLAIVAFALVAFAPADFAALVVACFATARDPAFAGAAGFAGVRAAVVLRPSDRNAIGCARRRAESRSR